MPRAGCRSSGTSPARRTQRECEGPLLDINYDLGDHIQLKHEVSWLMGDERGEAELLPYTGLQFLSEQA